MHLLLVAALLLTLATPARAVTLADHFELADFETALEGRQVTASFRLEPGLPEELIERIRSGLPTRLTYAFRLYVDRVRWFDESIDRAELQVAAMYNAITREYLINFKFDGKLIESRVVRNIDELGPAMTLFQEIPIFTLGEMRPDQRLLVRAKADIGSRTVMGFMPTAVTTEWVRSEKFAPPP